MSAQHHFRACNLCEAICGIEIVTQGESIQSIRGDKDDPLGRGHICPKALALQDIHEDPDRLRHPVRRTPQGWERISWKEAFDEVAARVKEIQGKHGRNAIGTYLGNPNVHNYGTLLFGIPLLRTLRTRSQFSASSLDQLPHQLVAAQMFGHQLLLPVPDIDRTSFFVIMGANPLVSNGSLMSAPDIRNRLGAIQERGGKVIVIDPRATETARVADQHVFIRPGTDALLLLAVLNVLHAEGLARPGRLEGFLDGLAGLWECLPAATPEKVAPWTGVEAGTIRDLARSFAKADSAVWYGRVGTCTQEFGTLTQWLINVVNIVTGNFDRPGGAMFTRPALDLLAPGVTSRGPFGRWRSRVRGLPEFGGELPAAVLAEEILTPGEGQIRGLITVAGNPVLSSPDGRQLEKALAQLEFMAAIDFYVNETTRHAHVILPPTASLEHENYDVVFHLLTIRNTARFSPPLFAPAPDTRHDWEILLELDTRLRSRGFFSGLVARMRRAWLRMIGPTGLLGLGLRLGPYGSKWRVWRPGLTLGKLKDAPHGIDLGPLLPCLPERLSTPDKRIKLVPQVLRDDLARLEARFHLANGAAPGEGMAPGLLLIGRRHLNSNNSWMHNSERLLKGKPRCTLLMHPDDGAARGVVDGQQVRVTSRVGSLEAPVELSAEMMPGVVSLPHGWGHSREGALLHTASQSPGVSINDITDPLAVDALSGTAAFSGVPVEVVPL